MFDETDRGAASPGNPLAHEYRDAVAKIISGGGLPALAIGVEQSRAEAQVGEANADPDAVITAVIDGGLPIGHARFRTSKLETRIEYAWIQDGRHVPQSFVPFGREFSKADIDQLLGDTLHGGQVDEDEFYRLTGQADFGPGGRTALGHGASHGAHVMDLAAGKTFKDPEIDKNPIICVQLPETVIADTSGESLGPFFIAALHYIWDRADRIAAQRGGRRLPLVINFSYGFIAGPHDGTHAIELAMDKFIQHRTPDTGQTAIVLPSGNRYLSQCHVKLEKAHFDDHNPVSLRWRIQPDDHTTSEVEFWMPESNGIPPHSRIEMTVTPPGEQESTVVSEIDGDLWQWQPGGAGSNVVATLAYRFHPAPTSRGQFTLKVQATADLENSTNLAPSGDWIVTVRDLKLKHKDWVDGWVQRDDTIFGDIQRGRQSYFWDHQYQVFNPPGFTPEGDIAQFDTGPSPIRRDGLINAMATGSLTVVSSGFRCKSGQPALYSAGGYTLNSARLSPDVMARSDTSRAHFGVIAAGTRSGSTFVQSGTSVAAPQLTRRIAQHLATGQGVERITVAQWAVADEAVIFANRPPAPPVLRSQSGRVATQTGYDLERIDFP